MNLVRNPFPLLALIGLVPLSNGYAPDHDTDWQEYGAADVGTLSVILFFDAAGVVHRANGHAEVWTKGVSETALDRALEADFKGKQKMVAFATERTLRGYQPPILQIVEADHDTVVAHEAAANVAVIEPAERTLYEFDCVDRLFRQLSISISIGPRTSADDSPREWKHVSPETAVAHLLKLVCTKQ